jgi:hypothetical protein
MTVVRVLENPHKLIVEEYYLPEQIFTMDETLPILVADA